MIGALTRRPAPSSGELWAEHEVAVRRGNRKRMIHPEVGTLDLLCEVMVGTSGDQRLVVLFAEPGSGHPREARPAAGDRHAGPQRALSRQRPEPTNGRGPSAGAAFDRRPTSTNTTAPATINPPVQPTS